MTAPWEPTSDEGAFSLFLPDYSVRISTVVLSDYWETTTALFEFVNSNGTVIDRFRSADISEGLDDKSAFNKAVEALYEDARRVAFGVDQALDKLLDKLGKT